MNDDRESTHAGDAVAWDATRYAVLRVLGAAPYGTKHLDAGNVLRFTNLDAFIDADIRAHGMRGAAAPAQAVSQDNGYAAYAKGWADCAAQAVAPSDPHDELSCVDCGASGDVHFPACPEAAVAPQPVGYVDADTLEHFRRGGMWTAMFPTEETFDRGVGKMVRRVALYVAPSPAPDTADERAQIAASRLWEALDAIYPRDAVSIDDIRAVLNAFAARAAAPGSVKS